MLSAGFGPPLVLLSGTNSCAANHLELIAALAATRRVHAIDLPGQPGLSHGVRPRRPHPDYGAWLGDLLPRILDEPPLVVGHSLGAGSDSVAGWPVPTSPGLVLVDPAGLTWLNITARVMRPTIP